MAALMAKSSSNKPTNKKERYTEMGTPLSTLVTACKGGEIRIDRLIPLIGMALSAEQIKEITDELKGLKDLLGAVGRGIESIE